MSSSDLHEVVLQWPYTDANTVLVTGTFDQWSSSVRLERTPKGFQAPVRIPFGEKIQYKFIVDGRWVTDDSAPTEADGGFINNVYTAPPRPAVAPAQEPEMTGNGLAVTAAQEAANGALSVGAAPAPSADVSVRPISDEAKVEPSAPVPVEAKDGPSVVEQVKITPSEPVSVEAKPEPSESVPEEVKAEPTEPATSEVTDIAAPVAEAATEAPSTPPSVKTPPRPESPAKPTMFDYAKGVAASFFPTLSPKGSRSSTPVPPAPAPKAAEHAPDVPMEIVPVAAPQDEVKSTIVPESTTAPASNDAAQSETHTHIPLPSPGKTDSSPMGVSSETAPPVMAAEPVSTDADAPKEVTQAATVAAVETAAAPTSVVEAKADETAAAEEKITAPAVLAAPPAETTPAEVIPVAIEPKQVDEGKPTPVAEDKPAPEAAPEAAASAEAAKPAVGEVSAPAAGEPTTEEPKKEPKDEAKKEEPKEVTVAPTTPKKDSTTATSSPPSNGHSRFGTLRSGSIRKLTFPSPHRRSSSHAGVESGSVDKSPASSVKDSSRKKHLSFFGKVREVLKDHKPGNGSPGKSK